MELKLIDKLFDEYLKEYENALEELNLKDTTLILQSEEEDIKKIVRMFIRSIVNHFAICTYRSGHIRCPVIEK